MNLEKTGHFKGHYYVLGGFINPLEEESLAHRRLDLLVQKLKNSSPPYEAKSDLAEGGARGGKNPSITTTPSNSPLLRGRTIELILALSPRREGDFTSLYIEEKLKPLREGGLKIKTTRLGRGLSSGAELEYADDETLKNALEGRR